MAESRFFRRKCWFPADRNSADSKSSFPSKNWSNRFQTLESTADTSRRSVRHSSIRRRFVVAETNSSNNREFFEIVARMISSATDCHAKDASSLSRVTMATKPVRGLRDDERRGMSKINNSIGPNDKQNIKTVVENNRRRG